jgi:hypothetical protein
MKTEDIREKHEPKSEPGSHPFYGNQYIGGLGKKKPKKKSRKKNGKA